MALHLTVAETKTETKTKTKTKTKTPSLTAQITLTSKTAPSQQVEWQDDTVMIVNCN